MLILIITAGAVVSGYLDRLARREFESDGRHEAALLQSHLLASIEQVDKAVLTLSGSPWIPGALTSNSAQDRDRAHAVLDRYRAAMAGSVCYVLDPRGLVVASSNRDDPDSFVGKSVAFRPYFADALAGRPGRYFAIGSVSGKRGYYGSAPVRDDAGLMVGVAVIKKDLDDRESLFREWPHSYVVSPDGVVFLANEPPMVFRSLWPVAASKRDELIRSRQFGELNWEPYLRHEPVDASYLQDDGRSHYVVRLSLPVAGWSIIFLKDLHAKADFRLLGLLATSLTCLLALFGYFAVSRAEERRRTVEERLEAELVWRKTFDVVGDLVAIIGADHRIRRINRAMALRLGMEPEEAAGRYCYELVHCTEKAIEQCPHDAMMRAGETCAVEVEEGRLGGDFLITASPLRGADGTVEGSVHVMHDITERRKRERLIQSLNVRLQAIIDSSPLAIVIIDRDDAVTLWNPAAERMFGWTEQEALAQPLAILPEDRQEGFRDILRTLKEGRSVVSTVIQCRKRDGRPIDISLSASPVLGADGRILSYLAIFEDITERKRLESDLLTAQKLESVGLLAGGIAHDLNNALNVILANLGFARMLGTTGRAAKALTDAEAACENAKELGTRLVIFSRGGAPVLERHPVSDLITGALNMFPKPDGLSLEIGTMIDREVEADQRQIRQVLRNLLINAAEAMPRGGVVRIDARELTLAENELAALPAGAYVRISVADEGSGIPPEILPKIFDPYFSTKDRFADRGLGLGLAVCWSIVRKHGGAITVSSTEGKGTVFHIYLRAA